MSNCRTCNYTMVLIGVSSGGLKALMSILPCLPRSCSLPIIIVQHVQENDQYELPDLLTKHTCLPIHTAVDKEKLCNGTIYLAPPGYHLLLEPGGTLALSIDAPICWARPSIDVLFESAAMFADGPVIAVILTGANSDGSKGLKMINHYGGMAIVQDPQSAQAPFMPKSAIATAEIDHVLPLDEIGSFLSGLIGHNMDG